MLSLEQIAMSPKSLYMQTHALLIRKIVDIVKPTDRKKFVEEHIKISMLDLTLRYKKELWLHYPI